MDCECGECIVCTRLLLAQLSRWLHLLCERKLDVLFVHLHVSPQSLLFILYATFLQSDGARFHLRNCFEIKPQRSLLLTISPKFGYNGGFMFVLPHFFRYVSCRLLRVEAFFILSPVYLSYMAGTHQLLTKW